MPAKSDTYENVRDKMKPGDVLAFSGKGGFSEIIKWATRSAVSHIGTVYQSKPLGTGDIPGGYFNQVIESNISGDKVGVQVNMISERITHYDGLIWWLPLSETVRKKMDVSLFLDFCMRHERAEYDMPQAIASALDALDSLSPPGTLTHNREDFEKFFCSELIAAALEHSGAIPPLNSSEVTPIDLCMFKIFENDYVQLKSPLPGSETEITGYNSLNPGGWGK